MNSSMRRGNLLLSSALAALLVSGVASAVRAADQTFQFNIPAESLSQALTDFSQASSQQLIYTEDLVRGRTSGGLHGTYTAAQALNTLLSGTDLKIEINGAGVMMVRSKNVQAASNEAAGSGTVETVVVTGSHIRGEVSSSQLIEITRADIDSGGFTSTAQVINALPQNYNGGSQAVPAAQGPGSFEFSGLIGSSTPSLRGLGDATLTLVDGHRLSHTGGTNGSDISSIPIGAIERIEVLPDGASSIYGSDAVAGVINVILRNDYDGLETTGAISEPTRSGGGAQQTASILGGFSWQGGSVIASYQYQNQDALYARDRDFSSGAGDPTSLVPSVQSNSATIFVSQDFTSSLTGYIDALYNAKTGSQDLSALAAFTQEGDLKAAQYSISAGLKYKPGNDWLIGLDADIASDREDFLGTYIFASGPSYQQTSNNFDRQVSLEGHADGPIFELPSGTVSAAVGSGYRREAFSQAIVGPVSTAVSGSREIYYGYLELAAPLVSANPSRTGLETLQLTASTRYDHYSDFGGTFNPKVGLSYEPTSDLLFKGSIGHSFRAPLLLDEFSSDAGYLFTGNDPSFPGGQAIALYYSGGNLNLRPETSVSWTVSGDYGPKSIPGLKITADYFDYNFKNKIVTPVTTNFFALPLSGPGIGPFVLFNPTQAQVQAVASTLVPPIYNFSNDPNATLSDVKAILDNEFANVSAWRSHGVDVGATYSFSTAWGDFSLSENATFLTVQENPGLGAASVKLTGTVFNPPDFRSRTGVLWSLRGWTASAYFNVIGAEKNIYTAPVQKLGAFDTTDLQISYSFPEAQAASGTRISLTASNVFDQDPPHVETFSTAYPGVGYDSANASPFGRVITLQVTRDW